MQIQYDRMHIKDNEPEWYTPVTGRHSGMGRDSFLSMERWKDPLWRGLHLRRMKAMAKKQNYHSSVGQLLCF